MHRILKSERLGRGEPGGVTPLDPVATPPGNVEALVLSTDSCDHDGDGNAVGYAYKQNMGYDRWRAADEISDQGWHRITVRLTKSPAGTVPPASTVGAGPEGRIEVWADGVKVVEYLGDDPARPEYGKVWMPAVGEGIPLLTNYYFNSEHKNQQITGEWDQKTDELRVYKDTQ